MIYVASPYTHTSMLVMDQRERQVAFYTAGLIRQGFPAFSPIVYGHSLHDRYVLQAEASFWRELNFKFLSIASSLHVLQLAGWEKSTGVMEEIEEATRLSLPLKFVEP